MFDQFFYAALHLMHRALFLIELEFKNIYIYNAAMILVLMLDLPIIFSFSITTLPD